MSSLETVYTIAVQLTRSPARERLVDDIIRELRWSAIVEAHRGIMDGIEAGRATFNRAEWDAETVKHRQWCADIKAYEARLRVVTKPPVETHA